MSIDMSSGSRTNSVDVVVIGGGINGTGVARDCALRGMSVALFERNDIAFGASGNSSGLIHGGPRYMTSNPDVTYSSCLDSGAIQRIAPHLLFRVPFVVPVAKRRGAGLELNLLDAFFRVYDRYQPLKRGKPHVRLDAAELRAIEPGLEGEYEGGVSFDEWGIDGVRLCIENALDAEAHGAQIHVPRAVTRLLRGEDGRVVGVEARNLRTGALARVNARAVVNATGAWGPLTAELGELPEHAVRLRPGKGIHVYFDRRLSNVALLLTAIDGRRIFLLPWQNLSVIATTDDDYFGDLDRVFATTDEVRYLIESVASVFPAVRVARVLGTWAGVRPTLFAWGKPEDALSREHCILDHEEHGARGLFSMLGGKLASYRMFAEEMSDRLAEALDVSARCTTHERALPGGQDPSAARELLEQARLAPLSVQRLLYRHGSRAAQVADGLQRAPGEQHVLCDCEPVTLAEVRHVVEREWAFDVESVARRTRLGLGACGGMRCAMPCARAVARWTQQGPERALQMARQFLENNARRRLAVVGPSNLRQEALRRAQWTSQLGVQGQRS